MITPLLPRFCLRAFLAASLIACAQASVLFDTGALTFSATGTQFGRIARTGEASTWGSLKPFPGLVFDSTARGYQTFTVDSLIFRFLQISLDDPSGGLFVAAYLNSYNPVDSPPFYGLDDNYLGDPGLSQPLGNPSFFQIQVAPNSTIVLPINEVAPASGAGRPFDLIVEGFLDADFTDIQDVPEPSPFWLFAAGVAALVAVRARASRIAAWRQFPRRVIESRMHMRYPFPILVLAACTVPGVVSLAVAQPISASALQQIQSLMNEKRARTAVQRKLSSNLVFASTRARGITPANIDTLGDPATSLRVDSRYGVLVDIKAAGSNTALLNAVRQAGGLAIRASSSGSIRARIPVNLLEAFAARGDVRAIKAASSARSRGGSANARRVFYPLAGMGRIDRAPFNLARYLGLAYFVGLTTTQGYITHGANTAIKASGANGAGVRVGVLSDSAEYIPALIASGDLPPGALNVADLVDGFGASEGSAMMEIVYDMAPGAGLFFASAFNSPDDFADNIRLLRNTYNCDVIVDDVGWSDEGVFQDTAIALAVKDVTQSGAFYLSAAGNNGNLTNANASAWEGDFVPGGVLGPYTLHSFGAVSLNRLRTTTGAIDLHWSDAWGSSANDYDLFVLNPAGTTMLAASTGTQDGTGDPWEEVFSPAGFPANSIVLIAAAPGALPRALHLENFFGEPLLIATAGQTHGHNATAGCLLDDPACPGRAFGVASVAWNSARGATRPFVGGASNPTESSSSDGPRRVFYHTNGTPITPGNYLFGTNGGTVLVKPDIAAADGVSCRTPGFSPFFGTSAAAPHAAGIVALVKAAKPSATGAQIWNALISTALDIRAPGVDRDSGYGIVMALAAVNAILH